MDMGNKFVVAWASLVTTDHMGVVALGSSQQLIRATPT